MRRWIKLLGTAFAVAVMGLILYLYGGDLRAIDLTDPARWPALAGAIALYVGVLLIGARGWKTALAVFGKPMPSLLAERHLLVSQIGKYLPGNVFHFAGRAALAAKAGVAASVTGAALVTETAATVLAGLAVTALAPMIRPELATLVLDPARTGRLVWLGVTLALIFTVLIVAAMVRRNARWLKDLPPVRVPPLLWLMALYLLSFAVLGASVALAAKVVVPEMPLPVSYAVPVFAIAWIAGLVTPGAPGGLGVRDSVLTLGLTPVLGGPEALTVALLHRALSVVGDAIAFAIGLSLRPERR